MSLEAVEWGYGISAENLSWDMRLVQIHLSVSGELRESCRIRNGYRLFAVRYLNSKNLNVVRFSS
jgi:hypothetical protein